MIDQKVFAAINRTIGRRLAQTIETRGMTRAQLAEEIGITEARMARVLKGSSGLTAAEFVVASLKLSATLNSLAYR
jgi:transcriptional regulator with XRE-family HTH domain